MFPDGSSQWLMTWIPLLRSCSCRASQGLSKTWRQMGYSSLSALMEKAHYHDQKLQHLQPVPILNVRFQ